LIDPIVEIREARVQGARFNEEAPMLELRGTILDWKPSRGPGNTHLYLLDGAITLRAEKLTVKC
jgi:hypothetical protein